jgi:hypothetical protein
MSGCGRKHRAKHLTQQYLDDDGWLGPDAAKGDSLAVCLEAPQSKLVKVRLITVPPSSSSAPTLSGEAVPKSSRSGGAQEQAAVMHASLPGKFHKLMWLGTSDVVVVRDCAVLQKPSPEQLRRFFSDHPEWEEAVSLAATVSGDNSTGLSVTSAAQNASESPRTREEMEAEEDLMMVNPNRNNIKHRATSFSALEDSSDDECDEEKDASDEEGNEVSSGEDVV